MSANLFQESRMSDLDRATQEYSDAKQNYQRLVRIAIDEQDPSKRAEVLNTIQAENARLVRVVEGLVAGWSQYNTTDVTQTKINNLQAELDAFNKDLESIQHKQDTLVQLQSVLTTLTTQNESDRNTYYGYIIAVLVLLILVFVMFVYSYARSFTVTSVASMITPTESVQTEMV